MKQEITLSGLPRCFERSVSEEQQRERALFARI